MKHLVIILALNLTLLICSSGRAQQLDNEVKLGLSYVLSFKGVTQDLELSDEQTEKLTGLWLEVKTKLEMEFESYQANFSPRFSPDKQRELKADLLKKVEDIREFELDRINEVLLPQQVDRLKQIRFQLLKRDSDGLKSLVQELNLTPEQLSRIAKTKITLKETIIEFRDFARKEKLTKNEILEEIADIRKKIEKDLLEILTPAQRKKLRDLEGEPFKVQVGPPKQPDD